MTVGADAELSYCQRKTDPTPNGRSPASEMVRKESGWISGISVTGSIQRRRQQTAINCKCYDQEITQGSAAWQLCHV